jgi:phosphoenolpyruvate-protein phosphotransferase (PTS system enzyme I)
MAGDPLCISILLGIGLDGLSMNARAIPLIKKMVRSIPMEQARADLEEIMRLNTANEVRAYLLQQTREMFPELEEKGYLLD